ncbi:hypothetical protein GGF46_000685 [Coemansia sp. RSA 552]|nr:hypothetical protein GGF46_000685 [Coemansia sp. RSA 552]
MGLFQVLPPPIIDSVVRYLLRLPHKAQLLSSFTVATSNDEVKELYRTCRAWRHVALTIMFARCQVVLGYNTSFTFNINESNPRIVNCLGSHLASYVKTISMTIDYLSIVNGPVLSYLEHIYPAVCFPNANSLTVDICIRGARTDNMAPLQPGLAEKIHACIRKMIPAVKSSRVCIIDKHSTSLVVYPEQLRALVQGLAQAQRSCLWLNGSCRQPILECCVSTRELTTLSCVWNENYAYIARILYANAGPLVNLYLAYACFTDFVRLVVDEQGNPVVYPRLTTLLLSDQNAGDQERPPKLAGKAPFPQLRKLQSLIKYPFADDTLFRDNSGSLESLYLMADHKILRMLNGHGVFAKGRLRSLRKLTVADCIDEIDDVDPITNTYMGVIGSVLDNLYELRAIDTDISGALTASLFKKVQYQNLQVLSLYCSYLSLSEVVHLLQVLPSLRLLFNRVSGIGSTFRDANATEIAKIMRARFRPLNCNFKRWCITNTTFFPESVIIASILLVADACPHLGSVILENRPGDTTDCLFQRLLKSKLYADFKDGFVPTMDHEYKKPVIHIKHILNDI